MTDSDHRHAAAAPLAIQPDEIRLISDLKLLLSRLPAGVSVVAREGALQVWVRRKEGRARINPPGLRWMQAATMALPDAPGLQPWATQAERNARVLAQVTEIESCAG